MPSTCSGRCDGVKKIGTCGNCIKEGGQEQTITEWAVSAHYYHDAASGDDVYTVSPETTDLAPFLMPVLATSACSCPGLWKIKATVENGPDTGKERTIASGRVSGPCSDRARCVIEVADCILHNSVPFELELKDDEVVVGTRTIPGHYEWIGSYENRRRVWVPERTIDLTVVNTSGAAHATCSLIVK